MHGDVNKLADSTVLTGPNLDHLPSFADCSFDSCVTDPPYELGFMGKSWDKSGIAYNVELWREVYRVMKPGAYLLAFGGSRTYHRMACAIEDAGFEIRDQIQWIYGSGFPKSLDVSKAIDKMNGDERPDAIKGGHMAAAGRSHGIEAINAGGLAIEESIPSVINKGALTRGTAVVSDDAKTWDGWGTALKPAHEPIVMARKPLEKGLTVAQNVLKWGTGAINVDGCRIEGESTIRSASQPFSVNGIRSDNGRPALGRADVSGSDSGRFPANVIHDGSDEVEAGFPFTQSGENHSPRNVSGYSGGLGGAKPFADNRANSGSASRFFYSPKASKYDREAGLDKFPLVKTGLMQDDNYEWKGDENHAPHNTSGRNHHPTVKPTDLMQYLCRLVTPPGGLILDPFLGSGSTMKAALIERFRCVGIELNPEYAEIAEARLKTLQVKLF